MIKMYEALIESIDVESNITQDTETLQDSEYNAIYKASVETINSNMKKVIDSAREIIINYRDILESGRYQINTRPLVLVSTLSINPVRELLDKTQLDNLVAKLNNCDTKVIEERLEPMTFASFETKLSDIEKIKCHIDNMLIRNSLIVANRTISSLIENIEDCNNIIISELSKCRSTHMFDVLCRIASMVTFIEANKIKLICNAVNPLTTLKFTIDQSMTEAADSVTINNEDVLTYVNELSELVPKCRAFFNDFKYKEIVTPRKKKIDKMMEYMRGALERKYVLRIPLYKVVNASAEAKDIIKNQFIKGLEKIVNKYPNYILMTPDFKDDNDMFIYLTLKEPFGKDEHRADRKMQSNEKTLTETTNWEDPEYRRINDAIDRQNSLIDNISARIDKSIVTNGGREDPKLKNEYDKACDERDKLISERHQIARRMMECIGETPLTTDTRNNLPDEIFGLPGRRYPLNDLTHIRLAISRMDPCTRIEKQDLANNICRQLCQQKLVGKVNISDSNPNAKYFPKWLCDQDATMDGGYIHSKDNKYSVKEILAEGLSGSTLEFYI